MTALADLIGVNHYHKESEDPTGSIHDGMVEFTRYATIHRALPDVRDGLKSVQRIALWTHYTYVGRTKKIKTAALAGTMLAHSLYAHGDTSASAAIQMMAAPYVNNVPYFTGHGAFGTAVSPRSVGAARYTSVSLSDFTKNTLFTDEDLYEMIPSVDGDTMICDTFLPTIPNVLLQGVNGMAIGFSTDILPHSLKDIKRATIAVIQGKEIKNIRPTWMKYDCEVEEIPNANLAYTVAGKVSIENTTTVSINSLHPDLNLEKLRAHLIKLQNDGKITRFIDKSAEDIHLTVKMTRSQLGDHTEETLVNLFKLKKRYSERLVMVSTEGNVRVYGSHNELIHDWVQWRLDFYRKRFEFLKAKASEELELLNDIIRCFDAGLPAQLPLMETKNDVVKRVKEICQGRNRPSIVEMASYRWTIEYRKKAEDRIQELISSIADHNEMLGSEQKRRDMFVTEVRNA